MPDDGKHDFGRDFGSLEGAVKALGSRVAEVVELQRSDSNQLKALHQSIDRLSEVSAKNQERTEDSLKDLEKRLGQMEGKMKFLDPVVKLLLAGGGLAGFFGQLGAQSTSVYETVAFSLFFAAGIVALTSIVRSYFDVDERTRWLVLGVSSVTVTGLILIASFYSDFGLSPANAKVFGVMSGLLWAFVLIARFRFRRQHDA